MMLKLGGTMVAYNVIKYDYCIEAALESLCSVCNQVVVIECGSDDGTIDLLNRIKLKHKHLEIRRGFWDCYPNKVKLSMLANLANEFLKSEWYFRLEADEVLHEDSFETIKEITNSKDGHYDAILCERFNLWRDMDHYVNPNYHNKPVGHFIARLGRHYTRTSDDAQSILANRIDNRHVHAIRIFHYGFVREEPVFMQKIIDMSTWFGYGKDERVVRMQEIGKFNYQAFVPDNELLPIPIPHPKFASEWIQKRRKSHG